MKVHFQIILFLLRLISINTHHSDDRKELKFNEQREFTILQLSDIHYAWSEELDRKNVEITNKLIDHVKPDLVVITGDLISGEKMKPGDKDFFKRYWNIATKPFLDKKVSYAYAMGNHDGLGDLNRQQIYEIDSEHPYSQMQWNNKTNFGIDYTVQIHSSYDQEIVPLVAWIFDTGAFLGTDYIREGYKGIEENQVQWYKELKFESEPAEKYQIAFLHVPLIEHMQFMNKGEFYGQAREHINCPHWNSGLFEEAKKRKDIKGFYCAHDHMNDFWGVHEGVELGFCRKTGYGSNGPDNLFQRGGRVFKFKELGPSTNTQANIQKITYIVNEDGGIEDHPDNATLSKSTLERQLNCGYPHWMRKMIEENLKCENHVNGGVLGDQKKDSHFIMLMIIGFGVFYGISMIVVIKHYRKKYYQFSDLDGKPKSAISV